MSLIDGPNNERFVGDQEQLFKQPKYQRWSSIASNLITARKNLERKWMRMYDHYRGNQTIYGSDDEIIVNVTFGHARVIESILYFEDPYFRVRPLHDPEMAGRAQLIEDNLNSIWYAERIGKQIRRCIIDAFLTGTGWMLVGFSDYHDPNLRESGKVYCRRINPLDLYTEDDISSYDEATYFIRRGLYSSRWLKKVFNKEWKSDVDTNVFKRRGIRNRAGRRTTQSTIYEIIDMVDNELLILSPQHKEILFTTEYPYNYFNGSMFVPLIFVEDPEQLYPISPTLIVDGQQDELNRIRTQQMRHRKKFNRRYLMQDKAIDDDELKKIEEGNDGTIAKTKGDPQRVLLPIIDAPLDPGSTRDYQQDIKADMREIIGINEYLKAGFVPTTKTAQEASMIQQGSNVRSRNMYTYLHEFIIDIAKKIVKVMQNEYDSINYIVKQNEDQYEALQWTKEDIAGDYDVEIELGSTLPPQPIPYETLLQQNKQPAGEGSVAPALPMPNTGQ